MRPIAPRPPRPAVSPSSSASSGSTSSVHRERECSPRTPLLPMAPAPAPGPVYPIPRTPMSDAQHYHSLFPRRRVAPPTPPFLSPPSSDDEHSVETYDPAAELVGDPNEPYVAEHVHYGAPKAYYSDASYGSERESASIDFATSSHHSSGSSSGSVSLVYGSASSGSASDGASDDNLPACLVSCLSSYNLSCLKRLRRREGQTVPSTTHASPVMVGLLGHIFLTMDLLPLKLHKRWRFVLALQRSYHGDTLGALEAHPPSSNTGFLQQLWYAGRGPFVDAPSVFMRNNTWRLSLPEGFLIENLKTWKHQ
ncbi:hypothetical protein PIB30_083167 [Stylosanthes scabra]|uniref:Uncharacterized protein n=1 Tax=Stylosanthes scabra TaxID=79078 RepID=A0ABU6URM0_9FABA|nr:hypothetical protein [Stylosanthes scabra]